MIEYDDLKKNFFVMAGPNVIESETHCLYMAQQIKAIMEKLNILYIFKCSFDKANRTSLTSYRGIGIERGLDVLQKVRDIVNVPIITDVHESWQVPIVARVADIIQVPAFLCRQTDLLRAVAETGKIIHVKKGQFCSADVMHKCAEKIRAFGNDQIILCERGNCYGYQDLIVDPRNFILLKSDHNLVSADITHCLQKPAQVQADGSVKAGGLREMIPYMGRVAVALEVNGIFMEVHDRPDESKCDAPTQWPLHKLEWLLKDILSCRPNKSNPKYNLEYNSTTESINNINPMIGTIEAEASGFNGHFSKENYRAEKILDKFLEYDFDTVLDIGSGGLQHSKILCENKRTVDICDYGESHYVTESSIKPSDLPINKAYYGDFNSINFPNTYDAIWCCHILEHQPNVGSFLKKVNSLLKEGGVLALIVPPRKPFVVGGHVTLWNAGLVLYNLVLAKFDCENCQIKQYDYNIGIILRKKTIEQLPKLVSDKGDIELLSKYFPLAARHGFNGDIMELNWDTCIEQDTKIKQKTKKKQSGIVICIPARAKSTRLPGKPLLKINNKTIIQHVWEQSKKINNIDDIYILTDCSEIADHVASFGGKCFIIEEECLNGTDRICKALKHMPNKKIIVNIQGDEPFINPEYVSRAIDLFVNNQDPSCVCATLYHKIDNCDVEKTSVGKLVLDNNNYILYCSRNMIPSNKKNSINQEQTYYGHIGVFVYDRQWLENNYQKNIYRCQLEEDIEWLNIIENGFKIQGVEVGKCEISVDTPEDYNSLLQKYEKTTR